MGTEAQVTDLVVGFLIATLVVLPFAIMVARHKK